VHPVEHIVDQLGVATDVRKFTEQFGDEIRSLSDDRLEQIALLRVVLPAIINVVEDVEAHHRLCLNLALNYVKALADWASIIHSSQDHQRF